MGVSSFLAVKVINTLLPRMWWEGVGGGGTQLMAPD